MGKGLFYRTAKINREQLKDRLLTVSISSETPVKRWDGEEILKHGEENVRLDWLQSGNAPLLLDHDPEKQIGVIENANLEGRRAVALVRFGRSALAEEVFQDIQDGIRKNISIGYLIHKTEQRGDKVEVTDFEILEVSIVSVPADRTVGTNRKNEVKKMGDEKKQEEKKETVIEVREIKVKDQAAIDNAVAKTRKDIAEITTLGEKHDQRELAIEAIKSGMSVEQFRGQLLDKIGTKPLIKDEIDLSTKEKREYSLIRAINAAAKQDWRGAEFELECSDEIAKRVGKNPKGFYVPNGIWGQRDLTAGGSGSGAEFVPTEHLAGDFIEALRGNLVIAGMGARIMQGLEGDVAIPKLSAGASAGFVAENSAVAEQTQTTAQVTLSPKTLGAYTDISRKLLKQSDPSVQAVIQADLVAAVAAKIEDVAIEGGGSNEPTGITQTSGIGSVALGTNGAAPTWASVVNLVKEVEIDNAAINAGTLGFLTNPKMKAKMAQTAKVSSTDSVMILNDPWTRLYGYDLGITTHVPSDLTKGTGSSLSAMIFGDFSQLMIGFWSGVDILVDPYTGGTAGTVRLIVHQDCDVAVRNAQSFAAILDAITT